MKKIFSIVLTLVILCGVCVGLFGCEESYKKFETEYFICREYKDRVTIPELTNLGKEQKILIVPAMLRNKPVTLLGETASYMDGGQLYSQWASEKLEKLFLMRVMGTPLNGDRFPKIKGIYIVNGLLKEYGANGALFSAKAIMVYTPNIFDGAFNSEICAANVGYFYNYTESPNNGYFWIDNNNYGDPITFAPPFPLREGHTFSGWYKEAECVNLWNFDTDKLPSPVLDGEGKEVYQELKLYAKWVKQQTHLCDTGQRHGDAKDDRDELTQYDLTV